MRLRGCIRSLVCKRRGVLCETFAVVVVRGSNPGLTQISLLKQANGGVTVQPSSEGLSGPSPGIDPRATTTANARRNHPLSYDTVVTSSDFQLPEGFGTNPLTLSRVATM